MAAPDAEAVRRRAALYERELTIVRRAEGLKKVLEFMAEQSPASYAERNALLVGRILATAAVDQAREPGYALSRRFSGHRSGGKAPDQ